MAGFQLSIYGRFWVSTEAEQRAMARAVRLRNTVEQVYWPRTEVERALKARSNGLELHHISLLEQLLAIARPTPFRVVFGAWAPTRLPSAGGSEDRHPTAGTSAAGGQGREE
jgi:hypothetical protein